MPSPRGRGIPDQEPRRPIRASWLNRVKATAEIAAAPILGPNLRGRTIAGRQMLQALPGEPGGASAYLAMTVTVIPSPTWNGTTLDAGGGGTIRFLEHAGGGEWTLGSTDETAYHVLPGDDSVPANAIVQIVTIDGENVINAVYCVPDDSAAQVSGATGGATGGTGTGTSGGGFGLGGGDDVDAGADSYGGEGDFLGGTGTGTGG